MFTIQRASSVLFEGKERENHPLSDSDAGAGDTMTELEVYSVPFIREMICKSNSPLLPILLLHHLSANVCLSWGIERDEKDCKFCTSFPLFVHNRRLSVCLSVL